MPSAKFKLSKEQASKVNAAHDLAGTRTVDAFENQGVFHTTVSGRSVDAIGEFGLALGGMTDEGVKAFEARQKAKAAKKA